MCDAPEHVGRRLHQLVQGARGRLNLLRRTLRRRRRHSRLRAYLLVGRHLRYLSRLSRLQRSLSLHLHLRLELLQPPTRRLLQRSLPLRRPTLLLDDRKPLRPLLLLLLCLSGALVGVTRALLLILRCLRLITLDESREDILNRVALLIR